MTDRSIAASVGDHQQAEDGAALGKKVGPRSNGGKGPYVVLFSFVVLWLAVLLFLVISGSNKQKSESHAARTTTSCTATAGAPESPRSTLTAIGGGLQSVAFGRDLMMLTRRAEFSVENPTALLANANCLVVKSGSFVRDTGDAELDASKINATTELVGDRLLLTVVLDRDAISFGRAGSYTGVISVIDPRVERLDVPLTVTLSYPTWQMPMALAIAVLFPAAVYVWLLRGSFTGKDTNDVLDLRRLSNYLFSRNGLLAFGAGVVAAFGVFSATYLSAATWDPTAGSYIALLGGTFSAFVAAATTVSAAGADRSGANL